MSDIDNNTVVAPEQAPVTPVPETGNKYKKFFRNLQIIAFIIVVSLIITGLVSLQALFFVINIVWILTFAIAVIFLILGGMVIFGLKAEAKMILDIFLEGSLSIVDFIEFIKLIIKTTVQLVKDTIFFLVPVVAYSLCFFIYLGLLLLYKWIGRTFDVTLLTIVLTAVLVGLVGLLNKKSPEEDQKQTWLKMVRKRFVDVLGDGMEVVIFVFFLTVDSTNLFFLPKELNIELKADVLGYNLMERGFVLSTGAQITFSIIMVTVIVELIRFGMRIAWGGIYFYKEINQYMGGENPKFTVGDQIKHSIRESFNANKDDMIKFITYFTLIIGVFIFFPRLKLLSVMVASITSLVLDILMRSRLNLKRGNDLLGKIISAVFRI